LLTAGRLPLRAPHRQGKIARRDGFARGDRGPNAGSLSIIVDPTGAMLGLWQPKQK
jgi:predicted enzyme related to lactoylglutathione lyase